MALFFVYGRVILGERKHPSLGKGHVRCPGCTSPSHCFSCLYHTIDRPAWSMGAELKDHLRCRKLCCFKEAWCFIRTARRGWRVPGTSWRSSWKGASDQRYAPRTSPPCIPARWKAWANWLRRREMWRRPGNSWPGAQPPCPSWPSWSTGPTPRRRPGPPGSW
jgi:hypothetical protein